MAQLTKEFVQSLFRGEVDGQGGVGLSSHATSQLCRAAADSNNFVPHPGNAERFLDSRRPMTWEEIKRPEDLTSYTIWELHLRPQRKISEMDDFYAWWTSEISPHFPRMQWWIVSSTAAYGPREINGFSGMLRILQAYFLVSSLVDTRVLRKLAPVAIRGILAAEFEGSLEDHLLNLPHDLREVSSGQRGILRVRLNPFRSENGQQKYSQSLDYVHLGLELRHGLNEVQKNRDVLPALVARMKHLAYEDFLVDDGPLNLAPNASQFQLDEIRYNRAREILRYLTPSENREDLENQIAQSLARLLERSPEDVPIGQEFNRSVFAPLWSWWNIPCYTNRDEWERVRQASLEWIASYTRPGGDEGDGFLQAYADWAKNSDLKALLTRCLAPGQGGVPATRWLASCVGAR